MARRRTLAAAVSAAKQDEAPPPAAADAAKPEAAKPEMRGNTIPVAPLGLAHGVHRPAPNPLAARQGALADIASGKIRDVRLRQLDPATCRMWDKHDRLYDRLTPASCEDLITSIRAQGRQEVPALVRRLKDDPDGFEYEVIAGARRHYAVSYLRTEEHRDVGFLAEIREMADEEAFRYSDIENRAREDISDYERGMKYAAALADYYDGNQTKMASRMEMAKGTLHAYVALAGLPDAVIDAYGDPREIAVRHGQQLSPLIKGAGRKQLFDRAALIAEAQRTARERGAPFIPGAEVFKMLMTVKAKTPAPLAVPYHAKDGRAVLTAKKAKGRVLLDVDLTASEADVMDAVRAALRAT